MSEHDSDNDVLHVGQDLVLPLQAVTEAFAILGRRGAGKTSTACVLAEEMIGAGQQVSVVDPTGAWWGLRSSTDGTCPGLPVVIFGGDHGDVPLHEGTGALIAAALVEQRFCAILDLSLLSKAATRRLMSDVVATLYRLNRDPMHVIFDEADVLAPQRTSPEGATLLGAMEDFVRRGRIRGLGATLVSQRPAVLHKDLLSQVEVLVCHQLTGPRDVAAIDEWIGVHAEDGQGQVVKTSLASLPVGTAWFWSPAWLQLLEKIQVRRRHTFDSSATPTVTRTQSQQRPTAQVMADIDLDTLGAQLAHVEQDAKDTDAGALRREVAQLRRQLAERITPQVRVEQIQIPVLRDQDRHDLAQLLTALQTAAGAVTRIQNRAGDAPATPVVAEAHRPPSTTRSRAPRRSVPAPAPATPGAAPATHTEVNTAQEQVHLKAGARRLLETLARHHPMRMTKAQLGTLTRFKVTGGTFQTYWSTLKRTGLVAEDGGRGGLVGITPAGMNVAGVTDRAPLSTQEVRDQWRGVLKAGARTMLDALIEAYPNALTKEQLAQAAGGMTITGGTFQTYLSTLRRNGLADVNDQSVRAGSALFLDTNR